MKISRAWLQTFFNDDLPESNALAEVLTFHAFEIESVENDVLDVKVTPNRGHDCLSHRGIAKEVSAILNVPLKNDGFASGATLEPVTETVSVSIDEPTLCSRYIAGYIKGVKVGPSPDWLRNSLESIGQRSINNIVDATNFIMFNLGQPTHAYDAAKLSGPDSFALSVRRARQGEQFVSLDSKKYELSDSVLIIADTHTDVPIAIAGVKGGLASGVSETTTDVVLEVANFDSVSIRKTSQALKLRTDGSSRWEQGISPELAGYGMRALTDLIIQLSGGEVVGYVDQYVQKQEQKRVGVTVSKVNQVLGTAFTYAEIEDAFRRLNFSFTKDGILGHPGETFTVAVPFERLDITIAEDLIEEVARIVGYDKVPAVELIAFPGTPAINANFYAAEHRREELIAKGYSEVFTSVFAEKGERVVLNKVDGVCPFLRASLVEGLKDAYEKNIRNKDLLGLKDVRIFEIGTIWKKGKEHTMLGIADSEGIRETPIKEIEIGDAYENLAVSTADRYQPFSKYPFIVRDIALWVPSETKPEAVLEIIRAHAGELLVRSSLFDQFQKPARPDDSGRSGGGEKTSYAFRLVFQSFDKTLTDFDASERMGSISAALQKEGYEIR